MQGGKRVHPLYTTNAPRPLAVSKANSPDVLGGDKELEITDIIFTQQGCVRKGKTVNDCCLFSGVGKYSTTNEADYKDACRTACLQV